MTEGPKACVIGSPIAHSRSPLIHNYWLKRHGIAGAYARREVTPDRLAGFFERIRQGEFAGCNVTIPHKERAFELVGQTDAQTQQLGSINTVFMSGGKLCGTSTDGPGFIASLQQQVPDWQSRSKHVVILGAGGAARAVIAALIASGVESVEIANRTLERAETIADAYSGNVTAIGWDALNDALPSADLLVNSTSLGMAGQPPLEIPLQALEPPAVVADIVYAPLETELIRVAAAAGHRCVDGLGMLLHQAAPGFEKWFGVRPEVTTELRQLIAADIVGE